MKKLILFFIAIVVSSHTSFAHHRDSSCMTNNMGNHASLPLSLPAKENSSLFRAGFKIGFNIPFSKNIDTQLKASSILSAEFGLFFKVGKRVFAEIGFGYAFQKNKFHLRQDSTMLESFDDIAEFRYLQIPILLTGEIPLGEKVNLMPQIGIIYQPLIQVTRNHLQLSKDNVTRHPFFLAAGIGIQVYFVTLTVAYRYSLTRYMQNSSSKRPSFLNISAGFQL